MTTLFYETGTRLSMKSINGKSNAFIERTNIQTIIRNDRSPSDECISTHKKYAHQDGMS